MPVPVNAPFRSTGGPAVEVFPADQRHRSSAAEEEAGAEELPPEDDEFYDTEEYMDMEAEWRKFYSLYEDAIEGGASSIHGLVTKLRTFADELESLAGRGWEMDPDEPLCDGGSEFALQNSQLEQEQWRLRRLRRREELARARQQVAALEGAAAVEGGSGATGMDTDVAAAAAVAGAAADGGAPGGPARHNTSLVEPKSPAPPPFHMLLRQGTAAFAMF